MLSDVRSHPVVAGVRVAGVSGKHVGVTKASELALCKEGASHQRKQGLVGCVDPPTSTVLDVSWLQKGHGTNVSVVQEVEVRG